MEKIWTVLEILDWSVDFLKNKGIEEAKYKVELMLSKVLNFKRFDLYLNFDRPLSKLEREKFKSCLLRAASNEPVQYILGEWEFYGYNFKVDNSVLIPRRETEELVEKVYEYLIENLNGNFTVADIGTGSGAIIISLYLELKKKLNNEDFNLIDFYAIDISKAALKKAVENANLNNAENIVFLEGDMLKNFDKKIDLLISNPPYVSFKEYKNLPKELYFEPQSALTDNKDGLSFYRELIAEVKERNIKKAFFEIGYNQKDELESMCIENQISDFKFHKDLSGNFRILETDLRS